MQQFTSMSLGKHPLVNLDQKVPNRLFTGFRAQQG
jgi:hypothetical protein